MKPIVLDGSLDIAPVPRVVVTCHSEVTQEIHDRIAFVVDGWLKGEVRCLIIPDGIDVEVYGIPKGGPGGYEVGWGVHETRVRFMAQTLTELKDLVEWWESRDEQTKPVEIVAR